MLLLPAPKKSNAELLRDAQERLRDDVARFQKLFPAPLLLGFDPGVSDCVMGMRNWPIQGACADLLPTGFKAFDQMWKELGDAGGFRPGELVLFAAPRPSRIKTLIGYSSRPYSQLQQIPKGTPDANEPKEG